MASAELGTAIHRWRDRLPPGEAGLPQGGRRRALGLRWEELAQLAVAFLAPSPELDPSVGWLTPPLFAAWVTRCSTPACSGWRYARSVPRSAA